MPNHRRFTDHTEKEILHRYLAGESTLALATEFKTRHGQIARAIVRQGYSCRSYSESGRKYSLDESVFDALTPESAYWAGFLMADGCIADKNTRSSRRSPLIILILAKPDRSHLEAFRDFLKSDSPITKGPGTNSFRLCVSSQRLADALRNFGVVPRKTFIATAPSHLAFNRDYWRGLIDGDGCICIRHKKSGTPFPTISLTGSNSLVSQFSTFCRSLCSTVAKPIKVNKVSTLMLSSNNARKIISNLYKDASVALSRKARLATIAVQPCPQKQFYIHGHPFISENRKPTNHGRTTYCVVCRREQLSRSN